MKKDLPLFYFPTTICWIDDDQLFLDALNTVFAENYQCLSFNQPEQGINFLKQYQAPTAKIHFTRPFTESDIFDTNNHFHIDIDINAIANIENQPAIQEEISILVIDYNMPTMNGIELCQKLKDAPYKKILLTGETCPTEVVEAFNNGLIHKFIKKDQHCAEKLAQYISELNYQYFYDKTKNLLNHIEVSHPSPLSDSAFVNFFNHWCQSNQITEYYLINRQGSFRVKDSTGKSAFFVVMGEHEKNNFLSLHDDAEDKVGNLLADVKNGETIPFFGMQKESWDISYQEWSQYFYPSKVIEGREKYYWTSIGL